MNKKINLLSLTLSPAMLFATATNAAAHEKWFHETQSYNLRWDLFFRPLPLVFVGAVLFATLAAWFLYRRRGRGFAPGRENLALWLRGLRMEQLAIPGRDAPKQANPGE